MVISPFRRTASSRPYIYDHPNSSSKAQLSGAEPTPVCLLTDGLIIQRGFCSFQTLVSAIFMYQVNRAGQSSRTTFIEHTALALKLEKLDHQVCPSDRFPRLDQKSLA